LIKILNNTLNLDIQNFNNLNKNDLKRSDWFQLILLSLINNNNLFELEFTKKGFNKSKELIGNLYSEEFLEKIKHLISLYLGQILENKNFSEAFNNKDLNSEKVSFLKNNIAQILNTNIENFKIDKEKLSFIEEIISYLIKLDSEEITPFQLNQILEKITFNFNQIHTKNLSKKLNNIMNSLKFQESFENREKFLIEDDRKWLEFIRSLNEIKSLRKIQTDINMANQSLNHKSQILADKETFQNNINISQMNNTQKLNENLSLRFKKFENKDFNINNLVDSYSEEKYLNLNRMPYQLNKENLIFKNIINENIKNNDLVFKKGEIFDKKLSFYETFQNLVHNELIKNHLEIGNITKLESAKVINFQKIPRDILEIVKDMVLEIQPHGEKKALIKIEPPEMGFLDLEIKVKNKEVEIVAKIERIELLQEIKQNLHNIKTSLEESGLNLKDVQLFLSSGFDNGNMVKNFEREERNYSGYKTKTEKIEETNNKDIKTEDLNKFYNRNGKYYYIV